MVALATVPTGRAPTSTPYPSIRTAVGPALRHVVPAAAVLTRPATNTNRTRSNLIDIPNIDFPGKVTWGYEDGPIDDGFSQYSEATSAVDELRELTGDLMAQLAELDKAATSALEVDAPAKVPASSIAAPPVDKQTRKAKREEQRASRRGAAASGTAAAPASSRGSSNSTAASPTPSATLYPKTRTPRSSGSRSSSSSAPVQPTPPPLPADATDRERLEQTFLLNGTELERLLQGVVGDDVEAEVEDEQSEEEVKGEEVDDASTEYALALRRDSQTGASVSRPDDEEDEQPNSLRAGLRSLGSSSRLSAQSGPMLPTPSRIRAAETASGEAGATVASSWGQTRQSRRANNHGRGAMVAAVAASTAAAAQQSKENAAIREKRGRSSDNPLSMFMKSATRALLTLPEEQALMACVEDLRFLNDARQQLHAALRRDPSMEEVAMTVMSTPESVAQRINNGNAARETMVRSNYRLVISIAKKYVRSPRDLPDLIAVGVSGLYKACDKFEPSKGFRFSTYATWWIRQAVMRNLTDQGRVLRLPSHIVEQVGKMRSLQTSLVRTLGRTPTDQDLAKAMNLTVEKVAHLHTLVAEASSLDISVGDGDEGDQVKDNIESNAPDAVEHLTEASLAGDLLRMLDCLDPREAGIVRMRYGLEDDGNVQTLDAVGRAFNITRERVRQIETKAIRKLREQVRLGHSIVLDYADHHGEKELAARNSRGTQKT